jgi:uncharacterized FlaG/YvyC family protein
MAFKRFTEVLRCNLDDAQVQVKAQELVTELNTLEVVKLEKAEAVAQFAKKQKELEARVRELVFDVGSKTEERSVDCREEPKFSELIVEIVREDTGAVVRRRPMEPSERQRVLFTVVPDKGN